MSIKETTDATEAESNIKNVHTNPEPKEEKTQKTVNMDATEETYIYIGPTTRTGLIENTIIKGTRESVEEYLKEVIDEIPQIKMLIVPTESLATSRAKAKKTGTLLNKYYNDVLSLSRKVKGA